MSVSTLASRFSPRTLRWALIGSLAVNVLVIGAVVSAMCSARFGGPHHERGFKGPPLLGFARTLPRERADVVRQKIADAQPNLETLRRAMRDARGEVRAAMTAEPFDQTKLDAALGGIVTSEANEARGKTALFGDVVRTLTPQERADLHKWLESNRPIR
jgi:uncharacterized membrane protein